MNVGYKIQKYRNKYKLSSDKNNKEVYSKKINYYLKVFQMGGYEPILTATDINIEVIWNFFNMETRKI